MLTREEALARRASLIRERHEAQDRQLATRVGAENAREQERAPVLFITPQGFYATQNRLVGMSIPADLLNGLPSTTIRRHTVWALADVIEAGNRTDSPALVGRLALIEVLDLAGDQSHESLALGIGPTARSTRKEGALEQAFRAAQDGVTGADPADGVEVILDGRSSRRWRWAGGGGGSLEGTLPVQALVDYNKGVVVGVRSLKHDADACARWAAIQVQKVGHQLAALLSAMDGRPSIAGNTGAGQAEGLLRQAADLLDKGVAAITPAPAVEPAPQPAATAGAGGAEGPAPAAPAPAAPATTSSRQKPRRMAGLANERKDDDA